MAVGEAFNIIPSVMATNGSALTDCATAPALPAGLSINASNCVITGTLATVLPSTSFVVTATNASGTSDPVPLTIEVAGDFPSLSYAASSGTNGTVGIPMTIIPSTFNGNGSTVTDCQITPALPAGLSINPGSCVISGTPAANISPTIYTVKAPNAVGFSDPALVTLSTGTHPPTLSYAGATGTSGLINTFMSVTPTVLSTNGSSIFACVASPGLPAGLSINSSTCVISGTPTSAMTPTAYSITATNTAGTSAPASVTLNVDAAVPSLSYFGATGTNADVGQPLTVAPTLIQSNGASITSCSSDPALPVGLTINPSTCVISGSVAFAMPPTSFAIRAANAVGVSDPATVVLSTGNTNPPSLSYAGATGTTGTIDTPMSVTPTTLDGNGNAITSCTVAPLLPAGLSINATTCVISGTPTVVYDATIFTVTVNNGVATTNATVTLLVNPKVPVISYAGATGRIVNVGEPMNVAPTTLNGNGALITNCTISPALPAGLEIDTVTCVISGTPTVNFNETVFSVTAFNSAGGSIAATVSLGTAIGRPILSYENAVGTYGNVGTPMSIVPTELLDNGSAITGCSISPPLPTGLSIDTTTCVISGTPTQSIGATEFEVVAQNPEGNSDPAPLTLSTSGLTGPPTLSYAGATGTIINFPNPLSVFPTVLNGNGAEVLNCGIKVPTTPLPAWAEIDPITCEIFGTPTSTMPNTTYTIVAGNVFGSSNDATVTIRVAPGVPFISYVDAEGTLAAVNGTMNIVPTVFQNNGATVTGCVATPALPAGVSINPGTCVISGSPVTPQPLTTYSVRATNSAGQSAAASVQIEVAQKPILDYDDPNPKIRVMAGRQIDPIIPIELVGGGADIINCVATPPLPDGLVLDPVTCAISGIPSGVDADYVVYDVVAMSAVAESNPARIEIQVRQGPPSLSYVGAAGTEASVGVETTITPTIFNNNGNLVTNCEVTPPLPPGLQINQNTCVISGTLTAPLPKTTFTVVATSEYNPPDATDPPPAEPDADDNPEDSKSLPAEVEIVGVSCPPGYIKIPANSHYGTADFCVMENEARCKGKNCVYNLTTPVNADPDFAIADAVNTVELPWVNIPIIQAQRACEFNGYKYDLISNREWMALGMAIAERGENWTAPNFNVGQGCLMQGNSGVTNPNCGYKSGDPFNPQNIGEIEVPTNAFYSRHKTSDQDGISDLAGNVGEWVDWDHETEGVQYGPSNCKTFEDDDIPLDRVDNEVYFCLGSGSGDLRQRDYLPRSSIGTPTAAKGLGMFFADTLANSGAAVRGGNFSSENFAGIFSLELDRIRGSFDDSTGFRCVWRPGTVPTRPNVTFSPTSKVGKVGVEFQFVPSYLEVNDDRLTGCTISPALPPGLIFDTTFCEVIGTPTTTSSPTNYTITPRNRAGNTLNPATINIRIDP